MIERNILIEEMKDFEVGIVIVMMVVVVKIDKMIWGILCNKGVRVGKLKDIV